MHILFSAAMFLALGSANLAAQVAKTTRTEAKPYATREGQKIVLHPSGISFQVPRDWIEWFDRFHNNLHLTREELLAVRDGAGEWDTECAKVVNAVLPFDDCAAHVGDEGWGKEGVSWKDVQFRVYLTGLSPQQILVRVHGPGLATARSVASFHNSADRQFIGIEEGRDASWQRMIIRYPVFYWDYGGVAQIRFLVRRWSGRSLVLVFMSGKQEKEEMEEIIQKILGSFSLN